MRDREVALIAGFSDTRQQEILPAPARVQFSWVASTATSTPEALGPVRMRGTRTGEIALGDPLVAAPMLIERHDRAAFEHVQRLAEALPGDEEADRAVDALFARVESKAGARPLRRRIP